jgi:hypothetical protein
MAAAPLCTCDMPKQRAVTELGASMRSLLGWHMPPIATVTLANSTSATTLTVHVAKSTYVMQPECTATIVMKGIVLTAADVVTVTAMDSNATCATLALTQLLQVTAETLGTIGLSCGFMRGMIRYTKSFTSDPDGNMNVSVTFTGA